MKKPITLLPTIPPRQAINISSSLDFFKLCRSHKGTVIKLSLKKEVLMLFSSGNKQTWGTCSFEVAG